MAARSVLAKSLFAAGWPIEREWQDLFVEELLKIRLGEDYYPGNFTPLAEFPYVLPGDRGISNSLAPQYADASGIVDISPRPPILWIRGDKDALVSDHSFSTWRCWARWGSSPVIRGQRPSRPSPWWLRPGRCWTATRKMAAGIKSW